MLRVILFLITICFIQNNSAQNIETFFLLVPDKLVYDLTIAERKELIKKSFLDKDEGNKMTYSISIDRKNGYLHIEQSFETGMAAFGKIDMCHWNCDNGEKLIAISQQGGNRFEIFQNDLTFYKYKDTELEPIEFGVFEEYSANTDWMMFSIVNGMVNNKATQKDKEKIYTGLLFQLPQKGKNLEVYYRESFAPGSDQQIDPLVEKMKYTSKTYIWQGNGTFK